MTDSETLAAFESETMRKPLEETVANLGGASGAGYADEERKRLLEALLGALDAGRAAQFFALWARGVPAHVRHQSLDAHRVEFYLRVYFAVFPTHPGVSAAARAAAEPGAAMATLREWLATTGAHLAKTSEFVPFYALPYVPDPMAHPAFQRVFDRGFPATVRTMAVDFFAAAPMVLSAPRLYVFYSNYFGLGDAGDHNIGTNDRRPGTAFLEGKEGLDSYVPDDRAIRRSIRKVAREEGLDPVMVGGGEDSRPPTADYRGAPATVDLQATEATLRRSMPRSLDAELAHATANGMLAEPPMSARRIVSFGAATPLRSAGGGEDVGSGAQLRPVDCDAVRRGVAEGSPAEVAALLRALRARVVDAQAGRARAKEALPLVLFDALGVRSGDFARAALELDSAAAEQLARLADILAGSPDFRAALADEAGNGGLDALAALAMANSTMPFQCSEGCRKHALSALTTLTLAGKSASRVAIGGVLPWAVGMLRDLDGSDAPSSSASHALEYGAALLMNLCLRKEGRDAAEAAQAAGVDVLGTLSNHLESQNSQVRAYVNGALYSVLRRRALREASRAMGLSEVLEVVAGRSNPVFASQLRFVIERLEREEDGDAAGDEEDANDDDSADDAADYLVDAELEAGHAEEGAAPSPAEGATQAGGEVLLAAVYSAEAGVVAEQAARIERLLPLEVPPGVDRDQAHLDALLASLDRRLAAGQHVAAGNTARLSDQDIMATIEATLTAPSSAAPPLRPMTPAGQSVPSAQPTPHMTMFMQDAPEEEPLLSVESTKPKGGPLKPLVVPQGAQTGELDAFVKKDLVPYSPR